MDNSIEAKELQIERKHFYVELRENERGKFLRITEEAHGRRNSIIVPSTGVDEFTATIAAVLRNGASLTTEPPRKLVGTPRCRVRSVQRAEPTPLTSRRPNLVWRFVISAVA